MERRGTVMQLDTKHFGVINFTEDDIITFEEGLPGFAWETQFVLLSDGQNELFFWMQSAANVDLAFVLINVKKVLPYYDPKVESEMLEDLGTPLSYYNIAVVPEDLSKLRVNLKAPIVINKKTRKGRQVVASNEEYGVRHYIFEELSQNNNISVDNGTGR